MKRSFGLPGVLWLAAMSAHGADRPIDADVCRLVSNAPSFDNKLVSIRASFERRPKAFVLTSDDCKGRDITVRDPGVLDRFSCGKDADGAAFGCPIALGTYTIVRFEGRFLQEHNGFLLTRVVEVKSGLLHSPPTADNGMGTKLGPAEVEALSHVEGPSLAPRKASGSKPRVTPYGTIRSSDVTALIRESAPIRPESCEVKGDEHFGGVMCDRTVASGRMTQSWVYAKQNGNWRLLMSGNQFIAAGGP